MSDFIKNIEVVKKIDTNEEYHGDTNFISSSGLKLLKRSPAHFKEQKFKKSDALDFGTAYHTYVLERKKFNREVAVFDPSQRPFPETTFNKKENKEWKQQFESDNFGKAIITPEDMRKIEIMYSKIASNRFALNFFKNGVPEESFYAKITLDVNGEERIIGVKVRPDYLKERVNTIIDLKTARDASLNGFIRAACDLDYHISAALYKMIIEKYYNDTKSFRFVFVAQEKEPPYAFNMLNADPHFLSQGKYEVEQLLLLYSECIKHNNWPAYQIWAESETGVIDVKLPTYAFRDYDFYPHAFNNYKLKTITNGTKR